MNFVKASLKYKQVTLTVLFLVFAFGFNSLLNMPRREDPKITIPAGQIVAYFPGADAVQTEEQVTIKIEEYLFRFNEVEKDKTHSTTTDGLTVVNVWLKDNIRQPDIFWSKLRHELMVVKSLKLPPGVKGPILNSDFGDTEAIVIGITGDQAGYDQLKTFINRLADNIRLMPAASKIKQIGEQKEEISIAWSPEKLSRYGISLEQVVKVLQSQNIISPAGSLKSDEMEIPINNAGYYNSIEDIKNQVVGASGTGAVIRLGDIAVVTRGYSEPTAKISVNGEKAMLLTVQMHEGNNIVKFGKEVQKKIREVSRQLPGNIHLTTIVNQPEIVQQNVNKFLREFLLAIAAVILVVFLLLPMSIAGVAATAIPMTISVTFALLHILGVELHQVSLAAMILVLGIVVDDAIIIADNYVELLDRGNDRWTAAWRSATDLVIPVLTATITIIAAFLPMVILTGTIGEFIHALPVTVSIALASSFLVAMFLTPLLCYLFIRKGLKGNNENDGTGRRKNSFLIVMQKNYNRSLDWCSKHPKLTITLSLLTIILAGILIKTGVRQRFFPEAERNQFTVELWMPTGTSLEKTEEAILKIENVVQKDNRVKDYATFVGQSCPRFYYNYTPEYPASNFAQILINTTTNKTALSLYDDLTSRLDSIVPEGRPHARLMMQGQPLSAPVEVRISGDEINQLKEIGSKVLGILQNTEGSTLTRSNFKEDYAGYRIILKEEAARLGFTTSSISQMIFAGISGWSFSNLYEGNKSVDIVLRAEKNERRHTGDLLNMYLQSPLTGTWVPLRQIADLKPAWFPGRIIHRNGIRTLSIQSETIKGIPASELLEKIRPSLSKIELPAGYTLYYGGEDANKTEVMKKLMIAGIISLILIFTVLLFQFRNLKEVGLVMLTIPLSLFGAVLGLIITGNDMGFTAFVGLISLSGIVVRNAIILIDHANELIKKGMAIPQAAIEAGKRRLRPIFLTASAAAIGVWPMILSGSQLWSPTASVIAFGVLWGMVMSTLAIPVMYMTFIRPEDKKLSSENGEFNHDMNNLNNKE
jgi:multidrug efflux pump subunit AcrB